MVYIALQVDEGQNRHSDIGTPKAGSIKNFTLIEYTVEEQH